MLIKKFKGGLYLDSIIENIETASAFLEMAQNMTEALEKYFPRYVEPADDDAEEEFTQVLNRIISDYEYISFMVPILKQALSHGCGCAHYALAQCERDRDRRWNTHLCEV